VRLHHILGQQVEGERHMGQQVGHHMLGVVGHRQVVEEVVGEGEEHTHMAVVVEVRKSTSCLTYGLLI